MCSLAVCRSDVHGTMLLYQEGRAGTNLEGHVDALVLIWRVASQEQLESWFEKRRTGVICVRGLSRCVVWT